MTEEELKQEAEEYADKYGKSNFDIWDTARFAYYQSAEPREKRISELESQIENYKLSENEAKEIIAELEAEIDRLKGDLELWEGGACRATNLDKCGVVKELKAQIEKMKCCENCAWWYKLPNGQRDCAETCENLDNWSLRR